MHIMTFQRGDLLQSCINGSQRCPNNCQLSVCFVCKDKCDGVKSTILLEYFPEHFPLTCNGITIKQH